MQRDNAPQSKSRRVLYRVGRILIAVVALLTSSAFWVTPAYAMDEPTSVTLKDITVWHDLIVAGDMLFLVPYEIPFTATPSTAIGNAFLFRMLSADGLTEIGAVTPYPYHELGYGSGLMSFYLLSGGVANTAYIFRVQQNPAYYPTPQYWDFVIGPANYSAATDQAAVLKAEIVSFAAILSTEYSVALLTTQEGVTTLSTYGEIYFLNAVPGLSIMTPTLFSVQIRTPSYSKRSWTTILADALKTKYAGTFIWDFMTGFAGLTGAGVEMSMNVFSVLLVCALMIFALVKMKATIYSSLIDGYAVMLLLMLSSMATMVMAGFVAFMSVVVGGVVWLVNRS